jgi:hypothetical protein
LIVTFLGLLVFWDVALYQKHSHVSTIRIVVCIYIQQGHDVHVIVDGVSSQQPFDREIALQRMSQAGAYLTTAQSAAFMLMRSK